MPELSEEMNYQILQDILGDNVQIQKQIQLMQQPSYPAGNSVKIAWKDLEQLDYIASQLVKKIKYLRGDRY